MQRQRRRRWCTMSDSTLVHSGCSSHLVDPATVPNADQHLSRLSGSSTTEDCPSGRPSAYPPSRKSLLTSCSSDARESLRSRFSFSALSSLARHFSLAARAALRLSCFTCVWQGCPRAKQHQATARPKETGQQNTGMGGEGSKSQGSRA